MKVRTASFAVAIFGALGAQGQQPQDSRLPRSNDCSAATGGLIMATCLISRRASHWALGATLALVLGWWPAAAQAQTYTDLHDFNGTGDPIIFNSGRLAQGPDGNFYAESENGGTSGFGTVFNLTPTGTVTIIHGLVPTTDGQAPSGGITLGTDGNFYGDAASGGAADSGTVFVVTPSGTLAVLHPFANSGDGTTPSYALILNPNGNFYGTTNVGPETIYQVAPSETFKTIHTLTTAEGSQGGQLSLGSDGNLYGGTGLGGTSGFGTAFKVTPSGVFTVLHSFTGATDGSNAAGGMVQATNGKFYGATSSGGSSSAGVIYQLTSSGVFTVLHTLNGTTDGKGPAGQLLAASDENLYGVTTSGGTSDCGTIFKITPAGTYTVLYNFDMIHGCNPEEQVIQGTNGKLYGLANGGGAFGDGAAYSLSLGLRAFAALMTASAFEGARIGILGQDFSGSSVVEFGGVPATTIAVTGSTFINATVPAGALTGSVKVTTGTTTLTSNQTFRVRLAFTTFTPMSGPVGTPVVLTGSGLTQTTKVTFGGVTASFAVNSDTQVTATVPAGATAGKIAIVTQGGNASSGCNFTVTPAITSFTPASGPVGTSVMITGIGLMGTTSVTFNGAAAVFTVNSDTQITATVPAGATTGKIAVTTPGGSATSATSFTVT
jgi:uncharacterized repeat protein (TIGR03803 family)